MPLQGTWIDIVIGNHALHPQPSDKLVISDNYLICRLRWFPKLAVRLLTNEKTDRSTMHMYNHTSDVYSYSCMWQVGNTYILPGFVNEPGSWAWLV